MNRERTEGENRERGEDKRREEKRTRGRKEGRHASIIGQIELVPEGCILFLMHALVTKGNQNQSRSWLVFLPPLAAFFVLPKEGRGGENRNRSATFTVLVAAG